jgi:hypothetical protein
MCPSSDKTEHMQDAGEEDDESIIKGRYWGKWGDSWGNKTRKGHEDIIKQRENRKKKKLDI